MQPTVSKIRAPISSVRGSFLITRSRFSRTNINVDDGGFSNNNHNNGITPRHCGLKALKVHCSADNGVQKTLDNLAKMYGNSNSNSKPVEKIMHQNYAVGSPKQSLGSKWREYQGSGNWEGLLDPLDENLRREIVKYGEFVQAAYSAFEFDPESENYAGCKHPKSTLLDDVGLGEAGYEVTECIHTTSSIRVPKWLTDRFSGDWMAKQTAFMGFVAVCTDEKELSRIGRRDIVVGFRGTVTPLEWGENLKDVLTPLNTGNKKSLVACCQPKVESGFWSLFNTMGPSGKSACDQVLDEIRRLVKLYKGQDISITITGHSLGAALSLLTAYHIGEELRKENGAQIPLTVFSFGGPRVGNRAFGRRMEELGVKVLRIVNTHDVITKVPGVVLNETWMQKMKSGNQCKIAGFLEMMPWAYCHVGTELRVNNKHSPYLKPDADMACCHDLEAYLHLVDGFLSSSIPFRSTAKRDLLRLLTNQKSNVLQKPNLRKEISWQ
ncbi:hypothetical protein SUGI_0582450 [Cryptomeria japonica]|uniref:phospholipase A(1) DAD1, chloroplastic n=1 Tax=Cryptomeria japonica TaxID=3369 RepID=UPI002414BB80|nr:phospholipase A(1) DAD1, chloroplastic [Cryptomeria japonica]GLJ29533.1 hypothetical protein SUGI_0582450 [Cryptomeria japonica]